jgi:hypothetical protein
MKMMTIIEDLTGSFIEKLDEYIVSYKLIGGHLNESPIWLQLDSSDMEPGIKFTSITESKAGFTVKCKSDVKNYVRWENDEFMNYFNYLKYIHIRDNHPTVWNDLITYNDTYLSNVLSFIEMYKSRLS